MARPLTALQATLMLVAGLVIVLGNSQAEPSVAAPPPTAVAYVTDFGSNSVTPVDTATHTPGTPIPVGANPPEVALTPDGATAYVTNNGEASVTPIDTATNTAGTPIPVGAQPNGVAVTPDGTTAYVADQGSGSVTPIDTATNTPGTPIPVGGFPNSLAVTPDGTTAYVTNPAFGSVTPIDIATNTTGTPIPVGANPLGVAIAPDGATAYVANNQSSSVTPIDIATNTTGTPIVVDEPWLMGTTPDGATVYVTNGGASVTPIDTATNTAGTPIPVGSTPRAVAVTPDGTTAYVASSDGVRPIDVATNTPGTLIPVSGHGIAIAPGATDSTAPSITLSTPPEGAVYARNQVVNADYACADEAGGSGLASCAGNVPSGSPLDTASLGAKTFTVNATDNAGHPSSVTHNYTVVYAQPDGQIRRNTDATFKGNNIYNVWAIGQKVTTSIPPGGTAGFRVRVENDGAVPEDITVTGGGSSGSFTVRYFIGYFNVTSLVTGAGLTYEDVAPGAIHELTVRITASGGATPGSTKAAQVVLTSGFGPPIWDGVRAQATVT